MGGLNLAAPTLQREPIASARPRTGGGFSTVPRSWPFFFLRFSFPPVSCALGYKKPELVRRDHHSSTGSLTVQTVSYFLPQLSSASECKSKKEENLNSSIEKENKQFN